MTPTRTNRREGIAITLDGTVIPHETAFCEEGGCPACEILRLQDYKRFWRKAVKEARQMSKDLTKILEEPL